MILDSEQDCNPIGSKSRPNLTELKKDTSHSDLDGRINTNCSIRPT